MSHHLSATPYPFLPAKFTLAQLQSIHEAILEEVLNKRNFRRKIIQKGIVKPTKEWLNTGAVLLLQPLRKA